MEEEISELNTQQKMLLRQLHERRQAHRSLIFDHVAAEEPAIIKRANRLFGGEYPAALAAYRERYGVGHRLISMPRATPIRLTIEQHGLLRKLRAAVNRGLPFAPEALKKTKPSLLDEVTSGFSNLGGYDAALELLGLKKSAGV